MKGEIERQSQFISEDLEKNLEIIEEKINQLEKYKEEQIELIDKIKQNFLNNIKQANNELILYRKDLMKKIRFYIEKNKKIKEILNSEKKELIEQYYDNISKGEEISVNQITIYNEKELLKLNVFEKYPSLIQPEYKGENINFEINSEIYNENTELLRKNFTIYGVTFEITIFVFKNEIGFTLTRLKGKENEGIYHIKLEFINIDKEKPKIIKEISDSFPLFEMKIYHNVFNFDNIIKNCVEDNETNFIFNLKQDNYYEQAKDLIEYSQILEMKKIVFDDAENNENKEEDELLFWE